MRIDELNPRYDLVIAGGGVTGAGTFHLAARMGLKPLLVEARDFAWGTSGRSSKMVHGGLRYLKQGKFFLTRSAVKERERLLRAYPGLVTPLEFIMPLFDGIGPSRSAMTLGLWIYSFMAGKKQHRHFSLSETRTHIPGIRSRALLSSLGFRDAQVDDARLVLRLLQDGRDMGGHALNYTRAVSLDRNMRGEVAAVHLADSETGREKTVETRAVVNATGALAEILHPSPVPGYHIRPLRGSHLVFPANRLPLDRVVSFIHPKDGRPVFLFPWEGTSFLGTTDVDHDGDGDAEPRMGPEEARYLMEGLEFILPRCGVSLSDATASIAGVRPVLSRKARKASEESREHVVWRNKGLATVTGGKLTTFALLARDALRALEPYLPCPGPAPGTAPFPAAQGREFPEAVAVRLLGRYGSRAARIMAAHDPKLFSPIGNTRTLWAELCHGAGHEQVRHLSDLLLRRVRLGLFLPRGGQAVLDRVQQLAAPYLTWDANRWEKERADYLDLWENAYAPPGQGGRKGP